VKPAPKALLERTDLLAFQVCQATIHRYRCIQVVIATIAHTDLQDPRVPKVQLDPPVRKVVRELPVVLAFITALLVHRARPDQEDHLVAMEDPDRPETKDPTCLGERKAIPDRQEVEANPDQLEVPLDRDPPENLDRLVHLVHPVPVRHPELLVRKVHPDHLEAKVHLVQTPNTVLVHADRKPKFIRTWTKHTDILTDLTAYHVVQIVVSMLPCLINF